MRSTTRAKKKCIFELNIEAQSISNPAQKINMIDWSWIMNIQLDCSGGGDLQWCAPRPARPAEKGLSRPAPQKSKSCPAPRKLAKLWAIFCLCCWQPDYQQATLHCVSWWRWWRWQWWWSRYQSNTYLPRTDHWWGERWWASAARASAAPTCQGHHRLHHLGHQHQKRMAYFTFVDSFTTNIICVLQVPRSVALPRWTGRGGRRGGETLIILPLLIIIINSQNKQDSF